MGWAGELKNEQLGDKCSEKGVYGKLRNLHTWNLHTLKISNIESGNVLWVVRAKNTEE